MLALMCLLGGLVYTVLNPFASSSATITIVPSVKTLTSTSTVIVSAQPAKTAAVQLQGRMLPSLTLTQVGTLATTGTGHQSAQAAYGTITFYNAAPYVQTVVAGTLLTGADGVQVVTDADAVIPAGNFATNDTRSNLPKLIHGTTPQLMTMISRWPTPTASDYRSGTNTTIRAGHAPPLNMAVRGRLNPAWVECLQGFPPGWTAISSEAEIPKRPRLGRAGKDGPPDHAKPRTPGNRRAPS